MAKPLYAKNDLDYTVLLEDINEATGAREPVTEGDVAGYLVAAATEEEAADITEPADPALVATCTHIGTVAAGADDPDNGVYRYGTWLIHLDRDDVTWDVCDPLFVDTGDLPFLVVDDPAGARVILPLTYKRLRKAIVAS